MTNGRGQEAHVPSSGFSPFNPWKNAEKLWPRRLLHIPSMTSYERSAEETYKGIKHPQYGILSYTWGRWQVPNGTSLPVRGVTWPIPRIDEGHFTADAFQRVVDVMGSSGMEWAWIDVACIDQVNTAVKMDEVGRQAGIFANAIRCFIWLSHVSQQDMQTAIITLETLGPDMWNLERLVPQESMQMDWDRASLHQLQEAVNTILNDPYFSSLWTLQEMVLRNDALILSTEGRQVSLSTGTDGKEYPLFMIMLINNFKNLMEILESRMVFENPEIRPLSISMRPAATTMMDRIRKSSSPCPVSTNPNIQYGMAKYRKTKHPEDRVYAIMQIYNVRVGQSARPQDTPPLEDLVVEFGLVINVASPVLGQLFLHTTKPKRGYSWCITEDSQVPADIGNLGVTRSSSKIWATPTKLVMASGLHGSFKGFCNAFMTWNPYRYQPWRPSMPNMYLDPHVMTAIGDPLSPEFLSSQGIVPSKGPPEEYWPLLAQSLIDKFGDNLSLLLLGYRDQTKYYPTLHVALLLLGKADETAGGLVFERLGFCTWSMLLPFEKYSHAAVVEYETRLPNEKGLRSKFAVERDRILGHFNDSRDIQLI